MDLAQQLICRQLEDDRVNHSVLLPKTHSCPVKNKHIHTAVHNIVPLYFNLIAGYKHTTLKKCFDRACKKFA